ncbi:MinD/ParA family ATP-binding protein [Arthrobacter sp. MA-N2]|uniref:MinD/ParA family ATP-binding protein n=1 Tax=Arthrobacter sp. MA-N2 TaxID=1101188 RepID=UPI00048719AF|nr:AAA family ATPase [Arthrobacter sp. MA-N2]
MAIEKSLIQPEPVISAIINGDNTGVLKINGEEHPYEALDVNDLRQALMKRVIGEAATLGRPVRVTSMDDTGVSYLVVSPSGEVEEEQPATVPEDASAIIERIPSVPAATTTLAAARSTTTVVREPASSAAPAAAETVTRRSIREAGSFLAAPSAVEPATQGFRGLLNSLGLSLAPSEDELSEREDIRLASKHFAGTRTIAVVNQKGGSNKTPTVAGLAAVFGRNGGSVVGWDNNPTTGTLGWRTEKGDHARSALDVIAAADALLSPTAQSADINAFVHHQSTDKYDVLRSDADVDGTHEVTAEEVDVLHRVVSKYYRLILMDSGNNHRSAEWNRMIDHADQLVVPTTNEEDRVEAALLTLQGLDLKAERSAELASNAVVIVSERQRGEARLSQETAEKFRPYVRDVVVVPFDEALKSGQIRFGALQPATRRAWLRAAAAVARGL